MFISGWVFVLGAFGETHYDQLYPTTMNSVSGVELLKEKEYIGIY
jgi:hypothetical protein